MAFTSWAPGKPPRSAVKHAAYRSFSAVGRAFARLGARPTVRSEGRARCKFGLEQPQSGLDGRACGRRCRGRGTADARSRAQTADPRSGAQPLVRRALVDQSRAAPRDIDDCHRAWCSRQLNRSRGSQPSPRQGPETGLCEPFDATSQGASRTTLDDPEPAPRRPRDDRIDTPKRTPGTPPGTGRFTAPARPSMVPATSPRRRSPRAVECVRARPSPTLRREPLCTARRGLDDSSAERRDERSLSGRRGARRPSDDLHRAIHGDPPAGPSSSVRTSRPAARRRRGSGA